MREQSTITPRPVPIRPRRGYRRNAMARRMRDRGLSEQQLADRIGSSQSYVNRVKNGRVQPTVQVAARFARALDTSIDELFFPEGLPPLPTGGVGDA